MRQVHSFRTAEGLVDFADGDKVRVVIEGYARSGVAEGERTAWFAFDSGHRGEIGSLVPRSGVGVVSITKIEEPFAVGDMVVHKECPDDPPDQHRKIELLIDFNGEPHLVCAPWGGYAHTAKIVVPVADYVRAKI